MDEIDHMCHNRKCVNPMHLRVATSAQNAQNTSVKIDNKSKLKGAHWCDRLKKWTSSIKIDKKTVYIGCFNSPEEAHIAYCEKAKIAFMEFFNPG